MLYLHKVKYLEARELPAREPYPASAIVTLLVGTETLNLVGKHDLLDELAEVESFADVSFELRYKRVPLEALGASGKGNVYRLSIVRLLEAGEVA
jgi:hypothetical protein